MSEMIFSYISLGISIISLLAAFIAIKVSDNNAKVDRRVEIYTDAIVSLDTLIFYEWISKEGHGEIFKNELDDHGLKNQMLDAVKIKSKLEILDEKKADRYWKIISQIFSSDHQFDSNEYEKLKKEINKEVNREKSNYKRRIRNMFKKNS